MKLSLNLEPEQWGHILVLLKNQENSYRSRLAKFASAEEYHGIRAYRTAVRNLSDEINAALEKK